MSRRVVITGMGVRAPGGSGTEEFWSLLAAGRTATRRISFFEPAPFRSQLAGECDFDAGAEGLTPRETRRMDRATQFAVVCARDAVSDSRLDFGALDPSRTGVSLGSAVAAATSLENEYLVLSDAGRQWEVAWRWPRRAWRRPRWTSSSRTRRACPWRTGRRPRRCTECSANGASRSRPPRR